ncbi:MAG: non-structural maintenance of chromosomes element 4 [Defluviitaleaceae bacterium]|nr:non-structural maintenance of chromosomes element 4 [Defluviitaleaceae bacterium]MCL2274130.1 non-structural maintenance of chromosomes element 4 [Defluviitaleaceae bacterium]
MMKSTCPTEQAVFRSLAEYYNHNPHGLTLYELVEIAIYTVRKINKYPESYGKTVENYFHLLFPDEIKSYLAGQAINSRTLEMLTRREN